MLVHADPHYLFQFFSRLYRMVFLMKVEGADYVYEAVTPDGITLGSLPDNYRGRTIRDMYPSDIAESLQSQYDRAREQKEPVFYSDKMNNVTNVASYATSILMPIEDDEGNVCYVLSMTSDMSEHSRTELLSSMENIDYLTKLPSLIRVKGELHQRMERLERGEVVVVYINLDRFRLLNELLGMEKGNEMLQKLAAGIGQVLPEGSVFGRVDGDEFIAVLAPSSHEEAETAAKDVLQVIESHTYEVDGMEISLSACIGAALMSENASMMIANACTAMMDAKQAGPGEICFYGGNATTEKRLDELYVEVELIRAVRHKELEVYYQPKLQPETGMVQFEALARWHSPKLGTVPPSVFIPVAEKSALIEEVTSFVLERVCRDMQTYPELFSEGRTAVNISTKLFNRPAVLRSVIAVLERCGESPNKFELEMTEQTLVDDAENGRNIVRYLRDLGFRVVIDDFGVSYSSLNYLKELDLDGIKIDQSFVQEIDEQMDRRGYDIVMFILSLAERLHLDVTAEGVETEIQLRTLERLGCGEMQGYYLSRPVPAAELAVAVERSRERLQQPPEPVPGTAEAETARLEAYRALQVSTTTFEEKYDRIVRAVQRTFQMPISFIALIDENRQYVKAIEGVPHEDPAVRFGTPREETLCTFVVDRKQPLVIPDTREDAAYANHPNVVNYGVRFYAGVPLLTEGGQAVGTLCVVDARPHTFTDKDLQLLEDYSCWVMAEMERMA
ncbi:EAL domain-containing protein [Alkalicoccus luteus]|uniref:EAL domain-containing protein n=1 Tax=Alkalicoccus luteus TaxID=1237094 RepID=A0A969PRT0_9BACI|nr:EAL domain-containing protein [Alkalicoccus luteus]NJP39236.1 EAL domain-containing protein [Alkalicoccus luteus]